MGNLACALGRRKKRSDTRCDSNDYVDVDTANGDSPTQTEAQPTEDVLYATIDHGNGSCKRGKNEAARAVEADDCDYAIVRIPTKGMVKIKEDGSDDYVLMG